MSQSYYFDSMFENRSELLNDFVRFDNRWDLHLISKLKKRKISSHEFFATITEINFGLFFDKFATSIRRGSLTWEGVKVTPDWIVESKGQEFVVEVRRINPANNVQVNIDFLEEIAEIFKSIPFNYFLSVRYSELADLATFSFSDFRDAVEKWLEVDCPLPGARFKFNDIYLKVVAKTSTAGHVIICGPFTLVKTKIERLFEEGRGVRDKLDKYHSHLTGHKMPYIVGVYLHQDSMFEPEEIFHHLYDPTIP